MNNNLLKRTEFYNSDEKQPHVARCQQMIKDHPEIATLFGRNPWTFAILLGIMALQFGIAAYMGSLGTGYWWAALIVAWVIGAFANHDLYVIIHEATHNMVFKNRLANRWVVIMADLANAIPGGQGFTTYHLKHHAHQGEHDMDTDLAGFWEAKLIGNSWWKKSLWLLFFPIFQVGRAHRVENVKTFSKWVLINIVCVFAVDIAVVYFLGWNALIYLVGSMFFAIGLHPLGARWIQEHYTIDGEQETHSYYGPINNISMNIGYHVEHHDFPNIPWTKIKQLKAMAPEYYDTIKSHDSWVKLWLDFIFNPKYSLFSRVTRENGKDKVVVEIGKAGKRKAKSTVASSN